MHPAVLTPQSNSMVPFPVFPTPAALRHFDYHPVMFPFHQQLAVHTQTGAFQYTLAGVPFQPNSHIFEDQEPKSSKNGFNPGQNSSSFTIDAILSTKRDKHANFSPENSPVSRKISGSHRRHDRLKSSSLPYSRSPQPGSDFSETPRSHVGCLTPDNSDKKSRSNEWKSGRAKRVRTIFTPEQLERLETEFERQQYMVGTERYYLATELNLTEAQVKVWFQNRRIKWRKQTLEKQQAQLAASDVYHGLQSDSEDESAEDASNDKDGESPKPISD